MAVRREELEQHSLYLETDGSEVRILSVDEASQIDWRASQMLRILKREAARAQRSRRTKGTKRKGWRRYR